MLTPIETLCESGGDPAANEDAMWHSMSAAVVLDGATGLPGVHLTPGRSDAQWLVETVVRNLRAAADGHDFERTLQGALEQTAAQLTDAIGGKDPKPEHEPMAALGAVSHVGGTLRYWLIGDVLLLLRKADGSIESIVDPRPQASEQAILEEWKRLCALKVPYGERRELVRPLILQARRNINTSHGYRMYSRLASSVSHAVTGSFNAPPATRFVLMTDGLVRASALFGASEASYFHYSGSALRRRFSWMRCKEMLDPEGSGWPRIKPQDDATGVLMEVSPEERDAPVQEAFTDHRATRFPVSVKGIVHLDGMVALLKNERNEWELPGGKLESDEQPESCVVREIAEELGLEVIVDRVVDTWVYNILDQVKVLIVTYLCQPSEQLRTARLSHEHKELAFFHVSQLSDIPLPDGYRSSIAAALGVDKSGRVPDDPS